MGGVGVWELVIILVLVLVIFGGRRMPELGRSLGLALANFRKAIKGEDSESGHKPDPGRPNPADDKDKENR